MDFKEKIDIIQRELNIVDIINRYAPRDIDAKGFTSCVSHNEKTPSMKVNFSTNRVHCFGCGFNGDCVDIVAKSLDISVAEAIDLIARDYNLSFARKWVSKQEYAQIKEAERKKIIAENEKNARTELIEKFSDKICNELLTLRKVCVILYSNPVISAAEMNDYSRAKERIKRLEDIYLTLNNLCQDKPKLSQNELIEKIKLGVIEV